MDSVSQPSVTGEELRSDPLYPLLYEELRTLEAAWDARRLPEQSVNLFELVQEAKLRLTHNGHMWECISRFHRAAALALRSILVDDAQRRIDHADTEKTEDFQYEYLLVVDEGLTRMEREDPGLADVFLLKYFAGLSDPDAANTLGISEALVKRRWEFGNVVMHRNIHDIWQEQPHRAP